MRRIILVLLVVVLGSFTLAQDQPRAALRSNVQTKQFTETFLNTVATGTAYDAFGQIKVANPGAEADIDNTRDTTQAMLDHLRPTYGKPIGFDMLAERTLGGSIIRYEALLKLEKNAIRCSMTYYKASDTWVPVRVWFDEDVDALFVELGR